MGQQREPPQQVDKLAKITAIDTIRGTAALYVLLNHLYVAQVGRIVTGGWQDFFLYGRVGVCVFIVLSGFCLGLSQYSNCWEFVKRRCKRLLPTYYAAVAVSALIAFQPLTWNEITHNLLLLIDLDLNQARHTNAVFWTIGIEFRLALLLPLFAYIFKQWGAAALLLTGVATAWVWRAIYLMVVPGQTMIFCSPWFVVLFVLGYLASQKAIKYPRIVFAFAVSLAVCLMSYYRYTVDKQQVLYIAGLMQTETAIGLATAAGLSLLPLRHGKENPVSWIGLWSYSLYLLHLPLVKIGTKFFQLHGITGWSAILIMILPILTICYLFFCLFERPFLYLKKQ